MPFKLLIAGGFDFDDYELLKQKADNILVRKNEVEIVSPNEPGAAMLGERYAKEKKLALRIFIPKWEFYGNRASFIRNEDMVLYVDAALVFHDGKNEDIQGVMNICNKYRVPLTVRQYEKQWKKLNTNIQHG